MRVWEQAKGGLCGESGPRLASLSSLAGRVEDYRMLEFILYVLSRESYIYVRYTGGLTRRTRPGTRRVRQGIRLTRDKRSMAERLLFYLYTTGNPVLREKRRRAFYDYITVLLNPQHVDTLCG